METFVISDTHFSHKNFLEFLNEEGELIRPFNSIEEMDELMINNWNKVVNPEDKVYHLGDVCFNLEAFNKIMPRLNGKKRLILGNHDKFDMKHYVKYFKKVYAWRILDVHPQICLCHFPLHEMCVDDGKRDHGRILVHGHIHEKVISDSRYFNVCVELTNYTPIALDDILTWYND